MTDRMGWALYLVATALAVMVTWRWVDDVNGVAFVVLAGILVVLCAQRFLGATVLLTAAGCSCWSAPARRGSAPDCSWSSAFWSRNARGIRPRCGSPTAAAGRPPSTRARIPTEFFSPLAGGRTIVETSPVRGYPPAPWLLRQHVWHGPPEALWALHREGLDWLASRGFEPGPVPCGGVGRFIGLGYEEGEVAYLRRPLRNGAMTAIERRGKASLPGALAVQPDIDERLAAIASRPEPGA